MIKAEDLRIGDLVKVSKIGCMVPKGTMCKVVAIDSENFFEEMNLKGCATLIELEVNHCSISFGIWCEDISPIPLTPEILEKNGWNKKTFYEKLSKSLRERFGYTSPNTVSVMERYCYTLPNTVLSIDYVPYRTQESERFSVYGDCFMIKHIVYVHELQHILWALGLDANLKI